MLFWGRSWASTSTSIRMEACWTMFELNEIDLIEEIKISFQGRSKPSEEDICSQIDDYEQSEIEKFFKLNESDYTGEQLEEYYDILFLLSKDALCYYLPFILITGLKEKEPDLLINGAIITMLETSYSESQYSEEWGVFSPDEIKAIKNWVMWLLMNSSSIDEYAISKAFENLSLIDAS